MIATPHSPRPYFPALLGNGADAVLLSYTGSMAAGSTGHSHFEQHQGCPCAWYKAGHKSANPEYKVVAPIVESGYQPIVNGEVCDIDDFEQRFDPVHAVLNTRVSARGARLLIEAFLTDDHILAERYRVEGLDAGKRMDLAFYVRESDFRIGALRSAHASRLRARARTREAVAFDYRVGAVRGVGRLWCDRRADAAYEPWPGLLFRGVRPGFSVAKYLVLADPSDGRDYRQQAEAAVRRARGGAAALLREHRAVWARYSGRSRVSLPDRDFQHLVDFGGYMVRAHQHPRTGAISVGTLPSLWGGGTHCPYDAYYAHRALLVTNRLEEARRHLGFYDLQRPFGRRFAREHGLPGAVYSGWSDCFGKDLTANLENYLLEYKPLMPAYILLDRYWQWVLDPADPGHPGRLPLMREILDLAVKRFVVERRQEAFMAPCMAGNESAVKVQNDTLNGLAYARAMAGYGEMAQALGRTDGAFFAGLARKLYRGLERNYRDGVLWPYRGAKYLTGMQLDNYMTNLPDGIDPRSVWAALRAMRTPWGMDSDQPSEAYRDWPWLGAWAAICLAHLRRGRESFRWLRHPLKTVSSLGMLPEKVRMDGYVIGYGYPTPHAETLWAAVHALCHTGPKEELRLLAGLDGRWRDLSFENLRLDGGLLASGRVAGGRVEELSLRNTGPAPGRRRIALNGRYRGLREREVAIPAGRAVHLSGRTV